MKIGIDARLYSQTGVGRYIRNLIDQFKIIDTKNSYVIFLNSKDFDGFEIPNDRWEKRKVDIHWHSLVEQIKLPNILLKEKCDLIHFPYFSIPIFYPGKFIITVHDLVMDHFETGYASSLPLFLYKIKHAGYKFVLKNALAKSSKIIAVSQSTENEIVNHYHINPEKISVTHEACESPVTSYKIPQDHPEILPHEYLLYVGNAYPHKNLERLLAAFRDANRAFPDTKLILVGKLDYFYNRLKNLVDEQKIPNVIFTGKMDDQELAWLYNNALCFVFPSLMEGFGLPPLEAMSYGCPVMASKIPTSIEVYGNACLYFNPYDEKDISDKIIYLIDKKNSVVRQKFIQQGLEQAKKYNWQKTSQETLEIYEKS